MLRIARVSAIADKWAEISVIDPRSGIPPLAPILLGNGTAAVFEPRPAEDAGPRETAAVRAAACFTATRGRARIEGRPSRPATQEAHGGHQRSPRCTPPRVAPRIARWRRSWRGDQPPLSRERSTSED